MSANMTDDIGDRFAHRLAQPEKEWANLTVEEIDKVLFDLRVKTMGITKTEDMVRAIEAKLKEKNT